MRRPVGDWEELDGVVSFTLKKDPNAIEKLRSACTVYVVAR